MKNSFIIVTLIFSLLLFVNQSFSQQEMSKPQSTYEKFLSDVGTMITKDFFEMPSLNSSYQKLKTKVIQITSGKGTKYFLSLSAKAKYGEKSAVIAYEDLLEIKNALKTIINKSKLEGQTKLEYRERYFATNDGFKLGYFQKGIDQTFFIEFAKYQSDDTYFFKNFNLLFNTINSSINKIESLKK